MGKCQKLKVVYQNCSKTIECIDYAICLTDVYFKTSASCTCVPGYYYNPTSSSCEAMVSVNGVSCNSAPCNDLVGLVCLYDSVTFNYVCQCNPDYFWNGSQCELSRVYNEACTNQINSCRASNNLVCNALFLCQCSALKTNYDSTNGRCY